jgi:hypothetical protein
MYDASICFCFLVKDGIRYLDRNIPKIINLGTMFRKYRIVYVENDSVDGTKELLRAYEEKNKCFCGEQIQLELGA